MNNDAKTILELLKKDAAGHKVDLRQGTFSPEPASKQLHRNNSDNFEDYDFSDFFLLVTKINKNDCEVIPGSLNGIMAGPHDIVLPKGVLGKYIFISPELKTSVPIKCLSDGFAALDDETYSAVMTQCDNLQNNGKFENSPFSEPLPYISDNDDRITYHNKLQKHVKSMQQSGRIIVFRPNILAKAAGFIFVGALITFAFWPANYSNEVPEQIAYTESKDITSTGQPTHIFRSSPEAASTEVEIYSPREVIYHEKPVIFIKGAADKTYKLTIVNKMTSEQIVSADIKSDQKITWNQIASASLKEDDTYTLQISDNGKTYKSDFWLADNTSRQTLKNEYANLKNNYNSKYSIKTGSSTIALTAVSVSKKVPKKFKFLGPLVGAAVDFAMSAKAPTADEIRILRSFAFAKLLFEKGYYSDAYVILDNIIEKHPDNEEYKQWRNKCLEKLK